MTRAFDALAAMYAERDPAEPQQEGRAFLAMTDDGGSNVYWLGRPCRQCCPYVTDPYHVRPVPCRHPRAHAWINVNTWHSGRVFAPRVDLTQSADQIVAAARRRAAEMVAEGRTGGLPIRRKEP